MQNTTVKELLTAVHGTLLAGNVETVISAINTDSRKAATGELFIPLVGERFDGHDYIDSALKNGAEGCLCARIPQTLADGKFYIQVADTTLALKDLASWYRGKFDLPVVQITGSVGKTTTKEMIASVVAQRFNTLKTAENFNNEIGTPQTLLQLTSAHKAAVIETGMDRAGQIRYLGEMVRPDVAVITNVGDAHIEFLGSRENIHKAKCEIFDHLAPDGVAVLNGDDALLNTVSYLQRIVRCGEGVDCDVRVSDIADHGMDGITCTVTTKKECYDLSVPAPGRHMIYAVSMAVAVGEELGMARDEIVRGVRFYEPAGSRMRVVKLPDGRRLLDDCYNANPQSMGASLRVLAGSVGKKIAVLGDMAELGELTEQSHCAMGELTAQLGIDCVIAIGQKAKDIANANPDRAKWFADTQTALDEIKKEFTAGSAMLVKASHSMHFEKIVEELTKA